MLLHAAAKGGDAATVGALLAAFDLSGSHKDAAGAGLEAANHRGQTPLHCACDEGLGGIEEVLLAAGANTSANDTGDSCTPLLQAILSHSVEVVRILLAAASTDSRSANAPNSYGDSALHDASCQVIPYFFLFFFIAAGMGS